MKDDAISRQAAIDLLKQMRKDGDMVPWEGKDVFARIRKLPSAQLEIIHCENCKHWKNNHLCECLSRYGTFETPKDFFCGYGKAK